MNSHFRWIWWERNSKKIAGRLFYVFLMEKLVHTLKLRAPSGVLQHSALWDKRTMTIPLPLLSPVTEFLARMAR